MSEKKVESLKDDLDRLQTIAFQQGYVCAVATLVKMHGESGMADELLHALGPVRWRYIEAYDRDNLKAAGMILKRYASVSQ